ncbi:MAG: PmoA family protein, partial [Acidobacteria bacterium]|nr:PmoA family protein [Acidobacteriota bacterium]
MRSSLLLSLTAAACLSGQVRFEPDVLAVNIDGRPFTAFHYGHEAGKPFLAPLRSASGKLVTRRFPMETVAGESRDHLHHRGLWFSFDDVNGVKLWENDPSYTKPRIGRIVVRGASWKDGDRSGTLMAVMEWRDPAGKALLTESRDMTFYPGPKLRIIDFHITLAAVQDVTLGDTKEGAFAIR